MEKRIFKREDLLTIEQVRRRLNCSRRHIYNLMDRGESDGGLPCFRVGKDRGRRIPADAVDRFLAANKMEPGA